MNKTLAQVTGVAVTSIVVLGTDMDVVYAVPLGLFAGASSARTERMGLRESPAARARIGELPR